MIVFKMIILPIIMSTSTEHPLRDVKRVPIDGYPTSTATIQQETETILLEHGINGGVYCEYYHPELKMNTRSELTLQKNTHLQFLARNMLQGFPARYMSQDASQPWLLFWTLQSFSVLQTGLDPGNRQRWKCIEFLSKRWT